MTTNFDLIIIGAGPGGETCAATAADLGLTVAVIERELFGGECPYWGCMPTHALLRPAQALAEARRVPGAAEATRPTVDVRAVLARRDEVVAQLHDDSHVDRLARRTGITIFRGTGRLAGHKLVSVEPSNGARAITLTADRAVALCTGTSTYLPPVEGLREAHPWSNREASLAKNIPPRLIVLGCGAIGVELAQAHASLGARVTIVGRHDRLITHEEQFASDAVVTAFRDQGITLHLGVTAVRVEREDANSPVRVDLSDGTLLEADELLVPIRHSPNTGDLDLDKVGVVLDKPGFLTTDRHMQVKALFDGDGGDRGCICSKDDGGEPWLYAVGDVTGREAFTHAAAYQAQVAARNIAGDRSCECVEDFIGTPRVIYTEPQVAAVGHTLKSARDAGINAIAVDRSIDRLTGSSFYGRGVPSPARMVFDADRETVIGATFVGVDVAELLHAVTIAIIGEVPLERLQHAVAPFPTRSQIWGALIKEAVRELATQPVAH